MFSTHFPTYWLNAQIVGHTCFFLKMLKDKILRFGRARKAHILKFRHIELAMNGNS